MLVLLWAILPTATKVFIMQNLHLYLLLAQSIGRYGAGPWVFTLVLEDGSEVDLYSATQESEISMLLLSSPGDSMTSAWFVGPQGCMFIPEVGPSYTLLEVSQSFLTYGLPVVHPSVDVAARVALTGQ